MQIVKFLSCNYLYVIVSKKKNLDSLAASLFPSNRVSSKDILIVFVLFYPLYLQGNLIKLKHARNEFAEKRRISKWNIDT